MICDEAVIQSESDDVNASRVNNTDLIIDFQYMLEIDDAVDSNENLGEKWINSCPDVRSHENYERISIDANSVNNDTPMTDPNCALTSSSKDQFISNDDSTAQYNTETQCNKYTNTEMTLLHTSTITDPITRTVFESDELDSNEENNTAQIQSNKVDYRKFIRVKCTFCSGGPWNPWFKRNRNCPRCNTKQFLHCEKCNKQYSMYRHIYRHLMSKCLRKTVITSDELDSNEENNTAQTQCYKDGPRITYKKGYVAITIVNKKEVYRKFIRVKCTSCGDGPWNPDYVKNRNCPRCNTERLLHCEKCNCPYNSYIGIFRHLKSKCLRMITYQCLQCPYNIETDDVMTAKKWLQTHDCANRSSEYKFEKCLACCKEFTKKSTLIKHMKNNCPNLPNEERHIFICQIWGMDE